MENNHSEASYSPPERTFITYAVTRPVKTGEHFDCEAECGKGITWNARRKISKVIVNICANGSWERTAYFHSSCYEQNGYPYGDPTISNPPITLEDMIAIDGLKVPE